MKKLLLSTTVLTMASAGAAHAQKWDVRVGGYFEAKGGYAAHEIDDISAGNGNKPLPNGDFDGFDQKSDAEIWFLPKITLDNGVQFGANIQLEAATGGDQIDEAFVFIQGAFGTIDIGSENSAGYKMTYAAPDVTFFGINSGDQTNFMPLLSEQPFFRGTLGTTFIENARNNDAERITYYTPRISGLQIGASYARDGQQDDVSQRDRDTEVNDIFDIGANYVNSFDLGGESLDVAVSGRYGTADGGEGGSDPDIWSAGANLGYLGFTVGGSFAKQIDSENTLVDGNASSNVDGQAWDAGISYETGPWGFSYTFFKGVSDDRGIGGTAVKLDTHQGAVRYALGPGIDLNFLVAYNDLQNAAFGFTDANGDEQTGFADEEVIYVASGVRIRF